MIVASEEQIETLSNREFQLLKLISQGFTRNQIAEKMHMSIHTYDSYRKNIRMKLHIHNQADWARVILYFYN